MNDRRYGEHELSECSHRWQRLDEPRPNYIDPGIYRCELCGDTFAEIGARIPKGGFRIYQEDDSEL